MRWHGQLARVMCPRSNVIQTPTADRVRFPWMHAPFITTCLALLIPLIAPPPFARAAGLVLADLAHTHFTILTTAPPTPAESLAASELAHYLQALSGAPFQTL